MELLTVDADLRNHPDREHHDGEFQRFFSFGEGSQRKGINNSAGFRVVSRRDKNTTGRSKNLDDLAFIVLVTTLNEPEWPDSIDLETGTVVYYGDNRKPGTKTNKTALNGNKYLEQVFELLSVKARENIPPFLLFENTQINGKSVMRFRGLLAPGVTGLGPSDDLVAVWRISNGKRFTNYKAHFTTLLAKTISRNWLIDLTTGMEPAGSPYCPKVWNKWVKTGVYDALVATAPRNPRPKAEQLPGGSIEKEILQVLFEQLSDREFEYAAAELVHLMDPRFVELEVTRESRDGGRDVIGHYRIGHSDHRLEMSVVVEAKKWNRGAVGVKPMSRLISRLKHRDLGVFVTTSYFETQVQRELIEDSHPVLLLSGGDIARLLVSHGLTGAGLIEWIKNLKNRSAATA